MQPPALHSGEQKPLFVAIVPLMNNKSKYNVSFNDIDLFQNYEGIDPQISHLKALLRPYLSYFSGFGGS